MALSRIIGLRTAAIGLALLIAAQLVASFLIAPRRAAIVPNAEIHQALTPGEFAGTLMLGGFRGLACDLLWMRADGAKQAGRFYEYVALYGAISRIQPRFELVWEYLAYDMVYNLPAQIEDRQSKWAWYVAGVSANARGLERNPGSERLAAHLAFLFMHRTDDAGFTTDFAARDWRPVLAPAVAAVNRALPADRRLDLDLSPGRTSFALAADFYALAVRIGETQRYPVIATRRRSIPLALEFDGNLYHGKGEHRRALLRWLDALAVWQSELAWIASPPDYVSRDHLRWSSDISVKNEGRLRRRAALLAERLAPTPETGKAAAMLVEERRYAEARTALTAPGWRDAVATGRIRWLGE